MAAPSYRFMFFAACVLAATAGALAVVYHGRWQDASAEVEKRSEVNPFAISLTKARDREYTFTVENYGYTYRGTSGNLIDDAVLAFGAWEKHILFFLDDYVNATGTRDRVFVDVGANTGQYVLFMAPRVKAVHAIEPFPPVLKALHANLKLNPFTNVTVHEVGLGEREATIPFFEPADDAHQAGGSFRGEGHDGHGQKRGADLRVVPGDALLAGTGPIGVMKIDIEGYEEAALKGLRKTLETHRPLVVLEVSTAPAGTIGSLEQLKALFPDRYECFVLAESEKQFVNGRYEVNEFAPTAAAFFKAGGQRNLVIVPAEHAAKMPRRRSN
ncbi:FkbM family methyltransferase [Gemmata sp. JC717]|uniref:FkbM family methyltransferase n=1 Tax=Gemmata algarum TaxID=2975278 RepID=UPI0021BB6037|nr:FkbM family methyltransferase [Gemmata algarum]MDY3554947.1 FkbM family methyltransferase [Gemmata algarum]